MTELSLSEQELIKEQFRNFANRVLKPTGFDTGCFGGINQKYWVNIKNKDYMFKFTSSKTDNSDFGEVFVSYLSFILGYKCVNATFCKDFFSEDENSKNNIYGTLIESYRTKNVTEAISLLQLQKKYKRRTSSFGNPVWEIELICKEFCEDNNIVCSRKLAQELKEMALLDYLFVQSDRGSRNIEFLIEEKHGKKCLSLAPMFDNGFCLHLVETKISEELLFKLDKMGFDIGDTPLNPRPDLYIQNKKTANDLDDENHVVKDLAEELLKNKALMKLYENFKKINIKNEVEFLCGLYKKTLSDEKKYVVEASIKNRINLLELELIKQKINKNFKEIKDERDFKL